MDTVLYNRPSGNSNIILILDIQCSLACRYCYISKSYRNSTQSYGPDDFLAIIAHEAETYRSLNIEVSGQLDKHITFLRKLLITLPEQYKETVFHFFFQLNGTELSKDVLDLIKIHKVSVGISCDGEDDINSQVRVSRGKKKSGPIIRTAINQLQENQLEYSIRCTISKINSVDASRLFNSLYVLKPSSVFLNRLVYKTDAVIDYSDLVIPVEKFLVFYKEYHTLAFQSAAFNLIDVNLKRWIYRFNNHVKGWTHHCSTGLCERSRVLTPSGFYRCPKFLGSEIIPKENISDYRKKYCKDCLVFEFCQGGCPLGNNYSERNLSDECKYAISLYDYYLVNKEILKHFII